MLEAEATGTGGGAAAAADRAPASRAFARPARVLERVMAREYLLLMMFDACIRVRSSDLLGFLLGFTMMLLLLEMTTRDEQTIRR